MAGSTYLEKEKGAPSSFFYLVTKMRRRVANRPRETFCRWYKEVEGCAPEGWGARGLGEGEGVESKGVIWVVEDRSTNINIRLLVNASGSYWRYVSQ